MKKIFGLVLALLLVAIPVFAAAPPLQTSASLAVAAPVILNGGAAWGNGSGGWGVQSNAGLSVLSTAQGTKSAQTTAFATGTAVGIGGAVALQSPHIGFGASGALGVVYVVGAGYGLGIDKNNWSLFNSTQNPDQASVDIRYSGSVAQQNGFLVDNGDGTLVGGGNTTGANFEGGSYNSSNGKLGPFETFGIVTIPAIAVGCDGAGAIAGGYTIGGYVDTSNFAAAGIKTVGFSGYIADKGEVYGIGGASHQAVVNNGSYGLSGGTATFSYAGNGNLGYGSAQTGGYTTVHNTGSSSTVSSYSAGSAAATVK